MTFAEYQAQAVKTNLAKENPLHELMQQVLGLGDEVGEVQAIFKKWIRDKGADMAQLDINNVKKELGDVLWYVAVVASDLGINLDDIANTNVQKLADRQTRGVLSGSGDNR